MTKDFETKTENDYIFKQGRYGKSWMGIDGDSDNRYLYWNATEVRDRLFEGFYTDTCYVSPPKSSLLENEPIRGRLQSINLKTSLSLKSPISLTTI